MDSLVDAFRSLTHGTTLAQMFIAFTLAHYLHHEFRRYVRRCRAEQAAKELERWINE